jgi:hypothetical protein
MCHSHYSHVDGRRLLTGLGSAASSGPRGRRRLPAVAHPLDRGAAASDMGTTATTPDRGTSATARQGHGAAATGWGSIAVHALGQPPSSHAASLMNQGGA